MRPKPLVWIVACAALLSASPTAEDQRRATAAGGEPTPALVRIVVASGEVIPARQGIWFVDPRTGAAEGWELAGDERFLMWTASPRGRAIAYGIPPTEPGRTPPWRLLDTPGGVEREIPARPIFSPDESRYALVDGDGIRVFRTSDGMPERSFLADRRSDGRGFMPPPQWSPDGAALLGWVGEPSARSPDETPLLRLDPATGERVPVSFAPLRSAEWSADGAQVFLLSADTVRLDAIGADDLRPRWSVHLDALSGSGLQGQDEKPNGGFEAPRSSPDGRRFALFARTFSGPPLPVAAYFTAYVIDPVDGSVRFWVEGASHCGPHVWSADGRWLLVNGRRDGRHGYFLVAADGSEIRYVAQYLQDLSPVDPTLGVTRGFPSAATLRVVAIPGGETLRELLFAGSVSWHFDAQQWLADGRLVVVAPAPAGRGGCEVGPTDERDLLVRFP